MKLLRCGIITAVLLILGTSPSGAQYTLWEGSGHWYGFTTSEMLYWDAENYAVSLGGHLVSIASAAENDFVTRLILSTFGYDRSSWIGFVRSEAGGPFVWTDGSAVTYTNWGDGEPNDCCGGEPYGHINYPAAGQWNDTQGPADNGYALVGVIEFTSNPTASVVPEPISIVLLGTGLAGVGAVRRRRRSRIPAG